MTTQSSSRNFPSEYPGSILSREERLQAEHGVTDGAPRDGAEKQPDICVTMGDSDSAQLAMQGFERAYEWRDCEGRVVCWCDRRKDVHGADEYLYVFAGHATFLVNSRGYVTCYLHENGAEETLRHLLLNQIIPRYLASTGRMLLHASAVTLKSGKTVAFLGRSGFGKSTLASSFHRHGAQLLSDDCILLGRSGKAVTAMGGLAGIRLFPDSVTAVFNESSGFTGYTPYTEKQQMILRNEEGRSPGHRVLDAMLLLNDPRSEAAEDVCIKPVAGSVALMAMIESAFALDPSDRQLIMDNFRNAGQAIKGKLGLYSLHYPRDHQRLAEVRSAVINCSK